MTSPTSWGEVDWTRLAPVDDADGHDVLRPVPIRSAAEQVLERLVTALALGVYRPGDKLPAERELAERLGVSRVTVREALARLESLGYVETRRGRYGGTFVTAGWVASSTGFVRDLLVPGWSRFEELFDASRQLLPVLARLAATRRRDADLVRLREAKERYGLAEEREAIRKADEDFHAAVARASQNSIMVAAADQLRRQLTFGVGAFPYSTDIHAQADREHRQMVDAIEGGDGEQAAVLAVDHFVHLVEEPLRSLYERSVRAERRPRGARSS